MANYNEAPALGSDRGVLSAQLGGIERGNDKPPSNSAQPADQAGAEPPVFLAPFAMADCMSSGLFGMKLTKALQRHFPSSRREDVYLAIGMAVAIYEADLTMAEIEIEALRREVESLRQQVAA